MGSPTIWYYPRGSTSVQSITLPRTTDLRDRPGRDVSVVMPVAGTAQYTDLGGVREIEIVVEKLDSTLYASQIRALQSLDSHLRSGGAIAFCHDADKAVLYSVRAATQGSTTVSLNSASNRVSAYNSSAALSSGDVITIEDGNPDLRRAFTTYSSNSGSVLTTGSAVAYSFSSGVLRYRDLYPVLRMSESEARGGQWLTDDHRLNYTMTLRLMEVSAEVQALGNAGWLLATNERTSDTHLSLDDTVRFTNPYQTDDRFTTPGGGVTTTITKRRH